MRKIVVILNCLLVIVHFHMNSETCLLVGGCCEKIVKQLGRLPSCLLVQLILECEFPKHVQVRALDEQREAVVHTKLSTAVNTNSVTKPEDVFNAFKIGHAAPNFMFCNSVF